MGAPNMMSRVSTMKKIAVILAFLALVNAAVDDVVSEQALVATNLETDPAVEDFPEYEFLNDAAFVEEVSQASKIDTDKLLADQKKEAQKNYSKLKAEKPKQKAKKKAARSAFKNGRKALRKNFRKCKKTISKKNPTLNSPKCAIFRTEELLALQEEALLELGKSKGKARRQARKVKRKLRRAARHTARKMRRGLRKQRRKARRALRKTWRKAKKAYRKFKKKLRGARFQVRTLPKIFKMLKPKIDKAMADMNTKNGAAKTGGDVVKKTPAKNITLQSVLRKYLSMSLHKVIDPLLQKVFDTVMNWIWRFLDPVVSTIKGSIVGSIGSVPFVGGFLAALAGTIVDKVYGVVKTAINNAVDKLRVLLQNKITDAMVNACFKFGGFQRNVSGAEKAGNAASNAVAQTSAKEYNKAAVKSEQAAKQAEKGVLKEAESASKSLEKTKEKDKKTNMEEDNADDKDKEEEEAEEALFDEEADEEVN